MELSNGTVTEITFHNDDTGFSVIKVTFAGNGHPVVCIGTMPLVARGNIVTVNGNWETNPRFGKQFRVETCSIVRPNTVEGITSFLSSGIIRNIGPVKAKQIVDRFGLETLEIIDTRPEKLRQIPGIGKKTVAAIAEQWKKDQNWRKLLLFLQELGVSYTTSVKIYKKYGEHAQEKISDNPYALCEDVWGIGFLKADQIARKMGFTHDSYKRIKAGLIYLLNDAMQDGHTCLPVADIRRQAAELLGVTDERVLFSLDHAVSIGQLIREDDMIFLPHLNRAEKAVAEYISRKIACPGPNTLHEGLTDIDLWITSYERSNCWQADPTQRQAIQQAIANRCLLITGGPGTGKTTLLKLLVAYFNEKGSRIFLTAPTGRAAQRLKDVTGLTAQTIHRLLEYQPHRSGDDFHLFKRNEQNPLETDIVIIDEVSMLDILLMSQLCSAIPIDARIVFVGDNRQLPSVGAGNVLADLIAGETIPHIHLTTIFRQASRSRIITAAHEINSGITPVFTNKHDENCFFLEQSTPQKTVEVLVDLVSRRLPASYGLDPGHDIQALSPMHKGVLGTENINTELQNVLRKSSRRLQFGGRTFFLGDKVMQVKNDYEKNVFNGDIGFVSKINEETGLGIDFQGNEVYYELSELDELQPAYCISIHKSQGCEFRAVIIPLVTQQFIMLQRNLVYTALTRARELCVFIGNRRALQIAVLADKATVRHSLLRERLERLQRVL